MRLLLAQPGSPGVVCGEHVSPSPPSRPLKDVQGQYPQVGQKEGGWAKWWPQEGAAPALGTVLASRARLGRVLPVSRHPPSLSN